jgi:hypothetical protein
VDEISCRGFHRHALVRSTPKQTELACIATTGR